MTSETELEIENAELRARLERAEEALRAIRGGEVDAFLLPGADGTHGVYTLSSADRAFRVLVEAMQEGAAVVSEDGIVLYSNRSLADMIAAPLDEVIGRPFASFMPMGEQFAVESMLVQAMNGHGKGEFALLRAGAVNQTSDIPVYLSASALQMDGRRAVGVVVTDLTERRRGEQIAAANRAKDDFLAMLSHELRTPLTPVLVTVQLLESDSALSPDQRQSLAVIRRNIEIEARLIDDLLDTTRISRGKIELRYEVVDAHATLRSALDIIHNEIAAKRMQVSLDLRASRHHVWADPARLQQVWWNLLTNAVKFTPDGGRISIRSEDGHEGQLRVEISDTGMGIQPQMLPKLFDAFEQGERATTRRFGGLGLGLTISKALVDLHGGKLSAASDGANRGATFTLRLATVAPPADARHGGASVSPAQQQQQQTARRILLVDDHADTLRMLSRLLQSMGYCVETATCVAGALNASKAEKFDLLISDIGLPDGSGVDIIRHMKARYGTQGIAVSGFGMIEDVQSSLDAGFVEHLTKPINVQTLEAAMSRITA